MNKAAMRAMAAGDMKGAQAMLLEALACDQAQHRPLAQSFHRPAAARRPRRRLRGLARSPETRQPQFPGAADACLRCWTAWGRQFLRPRPTASRSPRRRRSNTSIRRHARRVERARAVHGKYIGELGEYIRDHAAANERSAARPSSAAASRPSSTPPCVRASATSRSRSSITTRACRRSSSTSARNSRGWRISRRRPDRSSRSSPGSWSRTKPGSAPTSIMKITCRSTSGAN